MISVRSVEIWMDKEEFRPILGHLFQSEECTYKEPQLTVVTGVALNIS